jgi:hypothetical protein
VLVKELTMAWLKGAAFCVAILLGTIGQLSAQAKVGVMCADSQGKIVVRAKCRTNETKLTLGELASQAPKGDTGAAGSTGLSGYQIVSDTWESQTVPPEGVSFTTFCPAGKTTVGGGCYSTSQLVYNYDSRPFDSTPRAWRCGFSARTSSSSVTTVKLITYAICVNG